jgi:hypothetical protein
MGLIDMVIRPLTWFASLIDRLSDRTAQSASLNAGAKSVKITLLIGCAVLIWLVLSAILAALAMQPFISGAEVGLVALLAGIVVWGGLVIAVLRQLSVPAAKR